MEPAKTKNKKQILRQKVFDKYDGHCAYCGCNLLPRQWQVDHIWPKYRAHQYNGDINTIENLNPACTKCNNFKSTHTVEEFKRQLSMQPIRLLKNTQFQRALKFGLVNVTNNDVVFYFEKENCKS